MNRYQVIRRISFGFILCACAVTGVAQPAMSRGQQQLSVTYNECMNRARQALRSVGFTVEGAGNAAQGWRGESGAYIMCNEAPGNAIVVNIVVASISNDAGVPGNLRQLLQAQMERPGAAVPGASACGLGSRWEETEEGWRATWTRRGASNIFDVDSNKGSLHLTAVQTIEINGSRVKVTRTNASDGNNCEMEGTIGADGIHVTGSYRCKSGGPYNWSATILCR
jgi:hypothetical protein